MSLIIASSSQEQYSALQGGAVTRTLAGLEAPSSFQNHFTSPIKVPQNAEIAVESVKIRRNALIDIESNCVMYKYFGKLQTGVTDTTGVQSRLEMPIPIRPNPGTYNTTDWITELKRILNNSYCNPEIYDNYTTVSRTNASGQVIGMDIASQQRGDSSAKNQAPGASTMLTNYWENPNQLSNPDYKPGTSWTSTLVGANKEVERLQANNASLSVVEDMDSQRCSMIGHGHPFGLVDGHFMVDVNKSAKGWRVGLSRPQMEYIRDTTKTQPARQRANLYPGTRHPDGGFQEGEIMSTKYNVRNQGGLVPGRVQRDFYDFMIENDGTNISIYQFSYDNQLGMNQMVQSEVKYYGETGSSADASVKISTAAFNASYTAVEFACYGDKLSCFFGKTGDLGGRQEMVGLIGQTRRWELFLPISETRNALYPRLNMATVGDKLTITNYSSHYATADHFRFPSYDDAILTRQL